MARSLAELDKEFQLHKDQATKGTKGTPGIPPLKVKSPPVHSKRLEEIERAFRDQRIAQPGRAEAGSRQRKPKAEKTVTPRSEAKAQWRMFLIDTGCMMLAVYLLMTLVIGITVIHGDSMQPALHDNDVALIWRLSGVYEEGDMVLFSSDASPEVLVKRVVAGPGDRVEIDDEAGVVIVNNVILNEPYIYAETYNKGGQNGPLTLGENEYFVLGDNRMAALDSRYAEVGAVSKSDILGKIIFLVRSGGA